MEAEVIGLFEDLGYERKLDRSSLQQLLEDWTEYSKAVAWISNELKLVTQIDESVNTLETGGDAFVFQLELTSLLKELGCSYTLNSGDAKSRFDTTDKRLLTLHFLLTELVTRRILHFEKPQPMEIELEESTEAGLLKNILIDIGLGKPPANITIPTIWSEIKKRLQVTQKKLKEAGIELDPIFVGLLNAKQWAELEELNNQFHAEYQIRREMLLKRLDVTIQSFHWSDRLANQREAMSKIFDEHRSVLVPMPCVKLADVLAARNDLAIIEKTSSASVRKNTKSAINSVTIGGVPDRGGRPSEAHAPEREMPPWMKRDAGPSGSVGWTKNPGGGGGGYGGRGRGGGSHQGHGRGGGGGHSQRGRGDHGGGFNEYGGGGGGSHGQHGGGHQGQYGGGHQGQYGGNQDQYGGGHQGQYGGGHQTHYTSNEGWNQYGGGRDSGSQYSDQYYQGQNQQGNYQQHRGGGRGGNRSRVQGGWNN